jgi:hypothetical protein
MMDVVRIGVGELRPETLWTQIGLVNHVKFESPNIHV